MRATDLRAYNDDTPPELEEIDYSDWKTRYVTRRCAGKRVLDLGCVMHSPEAYKDRYFLHRAIAGVAGEVIGLDLNPEGVARLNNLGFRAVVGDAEAFAFDEPFDVIVAGDLVEHLGNLDGFLNSCLGALAPGGRIVVQTPNPWYWRNLLKAVVYREVPNNVEHTCWFCPRTFRQLVDRYGLTLANVEFGSRYLRDRLMPLPRGWRRLQPTRYGRNLLE